MRATEPLFFWAPWAVPFMMCTEDEPQRVVGFSVCVLPPPLARPCRDDQPASPLAHLLQQQGQVLRRPLFVRTSCNRRGEDHRSKAIQTCGTPTSTLAAGSHCDSASSSVVSTPAILIPDTARAVRFATHACRQICRPASIEELLLAAAVRPRKRACLLRVAAASVWSGGTLFRRLVHGVKTIWP